VNESVNRFVLLLALAFSLPGVLVPQIQPPLPQPVDSLLVQGIDILMQQRYNDALVHFRRLVELHPQSPVGYLFLAAVLQTRAIDYRTFPDRSQFDSLLAVARVHAEATVEQEPRSPWGHYYLGTALGMESYDLVQRGEFLRGYFKGRAAVSSLEKALELDSTFYDAYAVLGTYYYWKSRKTEFLHWLPFLGDDRQVGIDFLRRAVEHGRYQRFAALSNLLWIYLDAKEFQKAETLVRPALQRYPQHRILLLGLATALQHQGRYGEALGVYERQLQCILSERLPNPYNELDCRVNIMSVKVALNDTSQLRDYVNAVFALPRQAFPPYLREKVEDKFQQARRIEALLTNGKISNH
jgi:tetratricopeptide (TPR) repeat protein